MEKICPISVFMRMEIMGSSEKLDEYLSEMLYLKGSRSVILYIWTQLSRLNPDLCTLIISTQSHTNYTLDSTQSHTIRCHHHCITLPVKKHISMQTRVHGKEVAANSFQLISWIIAKINLTAENLFFSMIFCHTLYIISIILGTAFLSWPCRDL